MSRQRREQSLTATLLRSSAVGPIHSIMTSILSGCTKPVSCAARTGAHRVHPRRSSHRCAAHPVQEASAPEVRPADRAEGCSSATGGVRINPRWKQAVTGQSGLYFVVNNNFKVCSAALTDHVPMVLCTDCAPGATTGAIAAVQVSDGLQSFVIRYCSDRSRRSTVMTLRTCGGHGSHA